MNTKNLKIALIIIMFSCVSACSKLEVLLPRYSDNAIAAVHMIATDDVNQRSAVPVDIVFIFEEALVKELIQYKARKWFDEKAQFNLQYPGKFAIFSYEMVPVSQATLKPKDEKARFSIPYQKAFKVILYANYLNESADYTVDLSPYTQATVTLGNSKVVVVESAKR